jgi:putative FmdB family regulatory protein
MPTYHYHCSNCGHELEELQSFNDEPLLRCPECGTDSLARGVGGGAGLIFKGSGFYQTDYKKEPASPAKKDEKKETAGTGSEKKETPGEKTEKKETRGEKKAKSKKDGGEKSSEKKDG